MTQRFSLYEDLTVAREPRLRGRGLRARAAPAARAASRRCSTSAGSAPTADMRAGALSGGWKQRLALAAATIHEPELLVLDEPTAGVDPQSRREFWEQLFELAAGGTTIFVSTHYMDEAVRCHRLCMLRDGRRVAVGRPADLARALADRVVQRARRAAGARDRGAARDARGREHDAARRHGPRAARAGRPAGARRPPGARPAARRRGPRRRARPRRRPRTSRTSSSPLLARRAARRAGGRRRTHERRAAAPRAARSRRVLAVARKELRQLARDRLTLGLIVGIPSLQLVLFGYAINLDVRHVPTAVLDRAEQRALAPPRRRARRRRRPSTCRRSVRTRGRGVPAPRAQRGRRRHRRSRRTSIGGC